MMFIIKGLKYDTEKMKHIADVKKWYSYNSSLLNGCFFGKEVGKTYSCQLWKSKKGNWLLTHEIDYGEKVGQAIKEDEAKELLMEYAIDKYEELFGKIPEA